MKSTELKGKIIRGVGGFYYVEAQGTVYECRARGLFRKQGVTPLVGDLVTIEKDASGSAFLTSIDTRKSELIRPAVANADRAAIVFSAAHPAPRTGLVDRYLINLMRQEMEVQIVISKIDLAPANEVAHLKEIYELAGYHVTPVSNKTGEGIEEVKEMLQGRTTVLSGPSGVGKSSLINSVIPGLSLETGEISHKLHKGKNTTRHTEIIKINDDSFIIDTPGFSSVDLLVKDESELKLYMKEFVELNEGCRFTGCAHINEPDCVVKEAVSAGRIARERYDSYCRIYEEVKAERKW